MWGGLFNTHHMEVFKTVFGYNDYKVSNKGNVLSFKHKNPKLLSLVDYRGYKRVELFNLGKGRLISVHRLVAIAFIPNPKNKETVNHLDGNKGNNSVLNLEWATRSENDLHAYKIGLRKPQPNTKGKFGKDHHNSKPVIQMDIYGNFIAEFGGIAEAERLSNVSNVSRVCNDETKTAGGYKWKFANG